VERGGVEATRAALVSSSGQSYNCSMVVRGIVQNGVVVLTSGASVPEGTQVSVYVPQTTPQPEEKGEPQPLSEQERRRAALDEILALPDENPGDTFSGADHDRVLYGEPE
jgi:hypothetical protein